MIDHRNQCPFKRRNIIQNTYK